MKSVFLRNTFAVSLLTFAALSASAQIWSENFNAYADGTMMSAGMWTSYATDCDDGANFNAGPGVSQWGVWAGAFTINDVEGAPCCNGGIDGGGNDNAWTTDPIDISDYCDVSISLMTSQSGSMECDSPGVPIFGCTGLTPPDNSHDQMVIEYQLDGGGWIQFGYVCATNGLGLITTAGLNGNSLEIRVFAANKANGEFYYFDDVVVDGTLGGPATFNPIGPLCENDPPFTLPTVSLEGVTGTWDVGPTFDPSGMGGTTTTIEFTPNPGQCASPTTVDITVNFEVTPVPPAIGPFCQNDPPVPLPTTIGGVTGNWSAAFGNTSIVSGNMFFPSSCATMTACTPTIYFTPDPGQCALPTNVTVTVFPASIPPYTFITTYCENDPIFNLPTNVFGIMGNWSGPGVSGNTFDPGSSGTGTFPLTYTFVDPVAAQCLGQAGFQSSITVNAVGTPMLGTATLCETDPPFDLTAIQDPAYPTGTWSGPGVSGNTFIPGTGPGNYPLTFTPDPSLCATQANVNISVTMAQTPTTSLAQGVCVGAPTIDLTLFQDPAYPSGTWSGPGVVGNMFTLTNQVGVYTLTFQASAPCTNPLNWNFEIYELVPPFPVGSAVICENGGIFDLGSLLSPGTPTGVWFGPSGNVISPNFDPTGLSGVINLTYSPGILCGQTTPTTVTVEQGGSLTLGTATICENALPFDLSTIEDPAFPGGTWSGPGVSGNIFSPNGQSGPVNLTYTPAGTTCISPGNTFVTVEIPGTPMLGGMITLCQTSGIFNLTALNDPAFPAGTWSGSGVTGNNFDPSGQSGPVTLTFTPTADCSLPAQTTITVSTPTAPTLGVTSICEGANNLDLTTLEDPAFPTGTWTGPGVSGSSFDPAGQNGAVELTFTPDTNCSLAGQTTVTVNSAPTFSNLTDDCDPVTQTYTISFDINGGTPPYTVDGTVVTGSTFTSAGIPSGTAYSFDLDDANDCGPVTISGTVDCTCATDAGTMDFTVSPLMICHNGAIPINFNNDEFLDGNDLLIFVIHDEAGTTLGNILAQAEPPATSIPNPGLTIGETYYVSAVAGSDDGTGNIDFDDSCLSVAQGVPVEIYEPEMTITGPAEICAEDCADLLFEFSNGVAPYDIEYEIFANGVSVASAGAVGIPSSTTIEVCPSDFGLTSGTILFELTGFSEAAGCNATSLDSFIINVSPAANTSITPTLCPGENIVVNGTQYDEDNPNGQEIIIGGAFNGCDSTIDVALSYFPADTNFIVQTLCTGSSIEVNGTTYNETNPSGIEILPAANINGCDSTIVIDLDFNSEVTFTLDPTLCPGGSVTVDGTVYDESNPTGSETFPMGSFLGCDSTVNVNLSFHPEAVGNINPEICEGGSLVINGTVYDESNPTGQEILIGASVNGCDSTLNITLVFTPEVTENFDPTLCSGESVTINGTVYDEGNPTGSETFPMGSFLGCDSTVNVSLSFFPADTNLIDPTLCPGGTLTVNGTVYSELNPSGFEVLPAANVNGCDSVIFVDLSFNSTIFGNLDSTLCDGGSVMVNSTIYDASNPSGMETFPMGSFLGCDSTVIIDLSFLPPAVGTFDPTYCPGGSVVINGTVYDETNPTGTEILAGASFFGCDSTVNISLNFSNEVFENLDSELCPGESVTVNGTVYDEANPTGSETFPMGSFLGCDSTVLIDLSFSAPAVFDFTQTLCTGGSVTVNGTVYDEANPTGVEILANAAQSGCDSTINVNLTFDSEVSFDLDTILCPGEQIFINGTLYFEGNPMGSETYPGGSFLGCDSTVNVSLSFYPEATSSIDSVMAFGESIIVNGTVYDQTNPAGVEVILGGSSMGCDSTIFISLTYVGSFEVVTTVVSPTCPLDMDGSILIDTISGGQLPYLVSLNGGVDMEVFLFPVLFENLGAGFYSLTIRDAAGVISTVSLLLDNPPTPLLDLGADIEIDLGSSVILNPTTDFQPIALQWEPPTHLDCTDCLDPESTPSDDITYTLTATSPEGCVVSDDVAIFLRKERQIFAPDAFSPNNDAINDEFTLFAGPQVARIKSLLIFDRWGANVFEQYNFEPNNLSIGWDGTHNGEDLNPAVFVWFAEVEFLDGQVELFEGGLTLIR